MTELSNNELKEFVEIGLDRELDDFDMNANLFDDYGMESMGIVAMVVEIQRKTGVKIPDKVLPDLYTANDYLNYINKIKADQVASL